MSANSGSADFKNILEAGGLAGLGPTPRPGAMPEAAVNEALEKMFQKTNPSAGGRELIRSLLLLWHDHLDASHHISQGIENADGSFVHGIMHRREPDYGNAAYWFRRVGRHGAFTELAARVGKFLDAKHEAVLKKELMPRGEWDAFAFIDACKSVAGKPATDARTQSLREIQRIETEVLLERFTG
jgi:hypothetical protein